MLGVSSVENAESMFNGARAFNQPLDKPANLTNQCRMFHNCKGFTYLLNDKKCKKITYHAVILSMKR
ncbi:BspA family leucine-rich repeat surface protein [Campylobacter lanienae]|uniref:BspA family leucine-rich repeat surface protein n=1 Tax=Campylobacter lanienae TaxID=75658 RepID=UPI0036F34AC6